MAFCAQCGTQVSDGAKFCPGCGSAQAAPLYQDQQAAPQYQPQQAAPLYQDQQAAPLYQDQQAAPGRYITVMRVLSIIGFIWYPVMLFLPNMAGLHPAYNLGEYKGWGFLIYGYALTQAIVALVQARKHALPVIRVMGIIALVWSVLAAMLISDSNTWGMLQGLSVAGLCFYALAFSITAFVKSKRKA
jgi:hypothetical protein